MIRTVHVHNEFDPPPSVGLECKEPTRTRQSESAACNINNIIKQYDRTGMLPQVNSPGLYLDVTQMGDYREALHAVETANAIFMQLPAQVRADFQNDAATFLDWCSDPKNQAEMAKLGLAPQEAPPPETPKTDTPPTG